MIVPEWSDKFSVHNEKIDEHHKKLFEIASRAEKLVYKQAGADEIKAILTELFEYMRYHFKAEEAYMEQIGYADLPRHKEIHRSIIEQMINLTQNMKYDFKKQLSIIVQDWLAEHIMREDMKIEKWRAEHESDWGGGNNTVATEEAMYFYKCNCRPKFRVLATINQKIQGGQKFHCKKCGAQVTFVEQK